MEFQKLNLVKKKGNYTPDNALSKADINHWWNYIYDDFRQTIQSWWKLAYESLLNLNLKVQLCII